MYHIYFKAYAPTGEYLGSGVCGNYATVTAAAKAANRQFEPSRDKIIISRSSPFKAEKEGRRFVFS